MAVSGGMWIQEDCVVDNVWNTVQQKCIGAFNEENQTLLGVKGPTSESATNMDRSNQICILEDHSPTNEDAASQIGTEETMGRRG